MIPIIEDSYLHYGISVSTWQNTKKTKDRELLFDTSRFNNTDIICQGLHNNAGVIFSNSDWDILGKNCSEEDLDILDAQWDLIKYKIPMDFFVIFDYITPNQLFISNVYAEGWNEFFSYDAILDISEILGVPPLPVVAEFKLNSPIPLINERSLEQMCKTAMVFFTKDKSTVNSNRMGLLVRPKHTIKVWEEETAVYVRDSISYMELE